MGQGADVGPLERRPRLRPAPAPSRSSVCTSCQQFSPAAAPAPYHESSQPGLAPSWGNFGAPGSPAGSSRAARVRARNSMRRGSCECGHEHAGAGASRAGSQKLMLHILTCHEAEASKQGLGPHRAPPRSCPSRSQACAPLCVPLPSAAAAAAGCAPSPPCGCSTPRAPLATSSFRRCLHGARGAEGWHWQR